MHCQLLVNYYYFILTKRIIVANWYQFGQKRGIAQCLQRKGWCKMKASVALFVGLLVAWNCLASDSRTFHMELHPHLAAAAGLTTDQLLQLRDTPSVEQALMAVRTQAAAFDAADLAYRQAEERARLLGSTAASADESMQLKAERAATEVALRQSRLAAYSTIIQHIADCCGEPASQVASNCYANLHREVPFHWKVLITDESTWTLLESVARKLKHHEQLTAAELDAYQLVLLSESVATAEMRIATAGPALEQIYLQWFIDELQID